MNAFIVPIRDLDTHRPLPGVTVYDIGPKFGWVAKDNGCLYLKDVRIPRNFMLMRYINISKEGKVEMVGDPRMSYITML